MRLLAAAQPVVSRFGAAALGDEGMAATDDEMEGTGSDTFSHPLTPVSVPILITSPPLHAAASFPPGAPYGGACLLMTVQPPCQASGLPRWR